MSRYLVDVICTIEVECETPARIQGAVEKAIGDGLHDGDIRGWRVDDSFTVLEQSDEKGLSDV